MSLPSPVLALFTFLAFVTSAMGAETERAAAAPAGPTSAELVSTAYLAIVRDSIVRLDARKIATAALSALATLTGEKPRALPASFGRDPTRDAAWLVANVPAAPRPWPVIDAMSRSAETAHLWFVTPQRRAGM